MAISSRTTQRFTINGIEVVVCEALAEVGIDFALVGSPTTEDTCKFCGRSNVDFIINGVALHYGCMIFVELRAKEE